VKRYQQLAKTIGLPGLVTFASILASWFAIGFLLAGNHKLTVVLASIAFQLDVLDGFLARKLKRTSEFGRQLDSLSYVINYSVLAALVTALYLIPGPIGMIVGFLILAFGILRLALFNVKGFETEGEVLYYRGIITCHLSLATFLIFLVQKLTDFDQTSYWTYIVAAFLSLLAIGQISNIKTRKTGVLIFWLPVSVLIGLGGLLWL